MLNMNAPLIHQFATYSVLLLLLLLLYQARNDLKLSVSHNLSGKATKLGFTHDRRISGKKTTFKVGGCKRKGWTAGFF